MVRTSRKSRFYDLLAGFLAIFVVLVCSMSIHQVGADLRALFAITGAAFFVAGVARGQSVVHHVWSHGVLVSCPGLLGTAALIMNDGFHRLGIPSTLAVAAILMTVAGIQARRWWGTARKQSFALSVAAFALLGVLVMLAVPEISTYSSVKITDQAAPSFLITAFDGSQVNSSDFQGRVVVLAFWATWCLPCRWELPELEKEYTRYEHNPEVAFWAVQANWGGETLAKGKEFFAQKHLRLPGAFDSGGAGDGLKVESLPVVVVLDQRGRVRMVHYGYDASEKIGNVVSKTVEDLLGRNGAHGSS